MKQAWRFVWPKDPWFEAEPEAPAAVEAAEKPPKRATLSVKDGTATVEIDCCDGGGGGNGTTAADGIGATVLKVAGAAATGITATGFIVVVGAAVFWIRFHEVGVPATQAVGAIPRNELLVQGAQETIVYLAVALIAVLLVYFGDPKGRIVRATRALLYALAVGGWVYLFCFTDLRFGYKLSLAALDLAFLAGCIVVGSRTKTRFWPLALAVFVSALVFSAATGILVVKEQKHVQAVAILRGEGDAGLFGIYIAATDKTIYFAQPAPILTGGRTNAKKAMFEVPREGAVYAVGPLDSVADARLRARQMLERLIVNREREAAKPAPTEPAAPGATGPGGSAGAAGSGTAKKAAVSGDKVEVVAKAFGPQVTVRDRVEKPWDCLVRYASTVRGLKGRWWTSCQEDRRWRLRRLTVADVREKLALPGRFQPVYDMRVIASLPVGAGLFYLEGETGDQCEYEAEAPCGHRYRGSQIKQIYIPESQRVEIEHWECTDARADRRPHWTRALCFPKAP